MNKSLPVALLLAAASLPVAAASDTTLVETLSPASLGSSSSFGQATAIAGTQAAVGAIGHTQPGGGAGGAWVYERSGLGAWGPGIELVSSDQIPTGKYGTAVAIDTDRVAVGSSQDPTGGFTAGAVYVFEKQLGTWGEVQKLTPSDAASGFEFGAAVALEGDRLVIGAPGAKTTPPGTTFPKTTGALYVFERQPSGLWLETAKLFADDYPSSDKFGFDVDVSGDRILSGCYKDDDNGSSSGSAYVFERDLAGAWSQTAKLKPADGDSNDFFGYAVAIDNDNALVGAWNDTDSGSNAGSAYVFERQANGTWLEAQKLLGSNTTATGFSRFGQSLDLDGERAIVGAFLDLAPGVATEAGSATFFERDALGTWNQGQTLGLATPKTSDHFGLGLAISGPWACVGAKGRDEAATDSGAAFLFYSYAPTTAGTGTPGCNGTQTLGINLPPLIGTPGFGFTSDNAPPSSAGFLLLGGAADPIGADPFNLGILLHVDLIAAPSFLLLGFPSDASGTGFAPVPLPNDSSLVGLPIHAQGIWPWTTCALPPLDLSSTTLVSLTITAP